MRARSLYLDPAPKARSRPCEGHARARQVGRRRWEGQRGASLPWGVGGGEGLVPCTARSQIASARAASAALYKGAGKRSEPPARTLAPRGAPCRSSSPSSSTAHLFLLAVHRLARADADLWRDEDPQHRAWQLLRLRRLCRGLRHRRVFRRRPARRRQLPRCWPSPASPVGAARRLHRRARPAAPDVRPRRDRDGARHLRRVPDLRGRHQADLGRRPLPRLPALFTARPRRDRRHRLRRLRPRAARCSRSASARSPGGRWSAPARASCCASSSTTARSRSPWASTSRACSPSPSSSARCSARSAARWPRRAISVVPGVGVDVIVLAFAVSVIGGLGSVAGAAVGALIVGADARGGRAPDAGGRAVRHLRRDGHRADIPPGRPVRPGRRAEDLSDAPRPHTARPRRRAGPAAGARPRACRSWLRFLVTIGLAKGARRHGPRGDDAGGARLLRPGPLLRPRRLRRRARRQFLRAERRHPAARARRRRLGRWSARRSAAVITRYREIFFAMLSLALSMILYGILVRSPLLGSTDGFNLPAADLLRLRPRRRPATLLLYQPDRDRRDRPSRVLLPPLRALAGRRARRGDPVERDPRRVSRHLGRRASCTRPMCSARVAAGLGGTLVALATAPYRPRPRLLDDLGRIRLRRHPLRHRPCRRAAGRHGAVRGVRSFAFQYRPTRWQMVVGVAMLTVILFLPAGLWSLSDADGGRGAPA